MQRPISTEPELEFSPPSLLESGDAIERETWPDLRAYLSKYEALWRMHVLPLRNPRSIHLRDGSDEDFEVFAMNQYTTYVNVARAFQKIQSCSDDFKFAEEIWANLQRAAEVATKATDAFAKIYRECIGDKLPLDTSKLQLLEASIKQYRNVLHDPMLGTVLDGYGTRLIPRRDAMQKYSRWTNVMYHREESDFVAVEVQLRGDFDRVCGVLQDRWKQLEQASEHLIQNVEYLKRRSAGKVSSPQPSVCNPLAASGTATRLVSNG
jgi:hypothetical protein